MDRWIYQYTDTGLIESSMWPIDRLIHYDPFPGEHAPHAEYRQMIAPSMTTTFHNLYIPYIYICIYMYIYICIYIYIHMCKCLIIKCLHMLSYRHHQPSSSIIYSMQSLMSRISSPPRHLQGFGRGAGWWWPHRKSWCVTLARWTSRKVAKGCEGLVGPKFQWMKMVI